MDSPETDSDREERKGGGCCTASHSLSRAEIAADVRTLSAVGNSTRYEALRLIAETEDGLCVSELEGVLEVSQGGVSQALSQLQNGGLVICRKEGCRRYYCATERADLLLKAVNDCRIDDSH